MGTGCGVIVMWVISLSLSLMLFMMIVVIIYNCILDNEKEIETSLSKPMTIQLAWGL